MDANELREIVEAEVRRAFAAGESTDSPVLAVFDGSLVGLSAAVQQLAALAAERFVLTAVLSPCAEPLISRDLLRSQARVARILTARDRLNVAQLVQESVAVVVPVLSRTTLAKVANGIADTLTADVITHSLLLGKPVVAVRNAADPDGPESPSGAAGTVPDALRRLWSEHVDAARSFGVRFVDASELAAAVKAALGPSSPEAGLGGKTVITEADVVAASAAGELHAAAGAIITPLARDTAAQLGVRLLEGS
jgi:hypothetical protein